MRIQRLDLLRYGHFTDLSVDLPQGEMDLHVIFGPNEAGKSTAVGAIEDLLFGIPAMSPRNFLHDCAAMRVGAVLESGGQALEVRRRKGNKDTLLGANDLPLPTGDGAFAGLLGGADREFFARRFALDHERLRQGGRDIVEARDDVGPNAVRCRHRRRGSAAAGNMLRPRSGLRRRTQRCDISFHIPYRVELWDRHAQYIRWVVAAVGTVTIGHAAPDAAIASYPDQHFTLRPGHTGHSGLCAERTVRSSNGRHISATPQFLRTFGKVPENLDEL
jgi:hypothetical protein